MAAKKKHNPRSEAAQREAIKKLQTGEAWMSKGKYVYIKEVWSDDAPFLLAVFDLRDCFRLRQPLKGITKKLKSAIQPKRGRK